MARVVKPIEGNLASVKIDVLEVADFAGAADEEFAYSNPRHFSPGRPGIDGKGLDRDSMKELRDAIKDKGLFKPLMVRILERGGKKVYQIIAGERRWRACKKLNEDDEQCFNPVTGKVEPGSQVYESVECRLYEDIDDKEAMKMAFLENSTSVNIGEAANLNLFRYWRDHGFDDQTIMDCTKKTVAWVRHMDIISGLDAETLTAYCQSQINQTVALQLANVEDKKERVKILHEACAYAEGRAKETIDKAQEELGEAVKDAELAQGTLKIAEYDGTVDKNKAKDRVATTVKKVKAKRKKVKEAVQQGQAKAGDMVKAQIKVTGKPPKKINTALRTVAIQQLIVDEVDKLIEADGEKDGIVVAPVEALEIVKHTAEAISRGEKNLYNILADIFPPEDFDE